ncbi:MAG: type II secretion system F family protein [Rhodocyclaceae bacterium]|nr:type II secretion system F family protein [Rhodocyclaceae bacterium]
MPQFLYRALDGQGKIVSGVMTEADAAAVGKVLASSGLSALKVTEKGLRGGGLAFSLPKAKIPMRHVLEFTEQLNALLVAGLPLDRALKILLGTLENPSLHEVVRGVYLEVEKGHTLADAFSQYPRVFPKVYVNMIRAGEEGGILQVALSRLIDFYERTLEFRAFLVSSSIYPLLLFVFGIAALVVLAVVVIPKFGEIFSDMGQQLPFAAAVLIGSSNFLVKYGWAILVGLALATWGFISYIRTPGGQVWWHTALLRLPVIGKLILKIQLARLTRTLGTLLSSGVPILSSVNIIQGLTENVPLKRAIDRLYQGIKDGKGVARPLRADSFFPPLLGHLATVGEETGSLDKMLLKVADQYDADVKKATKGFIAIFEPAMIVLMGGLIGTIVVSMLTAIFSINDLPM